MDYSSKSITYYKNIRHEMLAFFPENAKKVLDVGCGQGYFSKAIKNKHNTENWGVEYVVEHAEEATKLLDKVFSGPIETNYNNLPDNYFDVIFFNDVLEHLTYPEDVLKVMKQKLSDGGVIISSLPNVRYHNTLRMFIFNKDWKYEQHGVMDFTHFRFFTAKSIKRMYKNLGFQIISHQGINKSKSLKPIFLNALLLFTASDIFFPQFATVVKK